MIELQAQWKRRNKREVGTCSSCGGVIDDWVIHFQSFDGNQLEKNTRDGA
jgi:hypothetical protein